MRSKIISKRIVLIVILLGLILAAGFFVYSISEKTTPESFPTLTTNIPDRSEKEKIKYGLPIRLKIPKINIDAAIEYVGTASNGAMDVPKSPDTVAWFKLGTRPGEIGSAVIAGHYGTWKNGEKSAFDDLHKLRVDDKLFVEDDQGKTIGFEVRESRSYDPNADTKDIFISNDNKSHLNLITCEGDWDEESESYSSRLVVFTDFVL